MKSKYPKVRKSTDFLAVGDRVKVIAGDNCKGRTAFVEECVYIEGEYQYSLLPCGAWFERDVLKLLPETKGQIEKFLKAKMKSVKEEDDTEYDEDDEEHQPYHDTFPPKNGW